MTKNKPKLRMILRCNMPREQSRMALKKTLIITACIFAFWVAGGILAHSQSSPTIRDVERQLDRHVLTGHEYIDARVARLEIAVAANSNQMTWVRGGGASLGLIMIGLNVLNLVGWKINVVRVKQNGGPQP